MPWADLKKGQTEAFTRFCPIFFQPLPSSSASASFCLRLLLPPPPSASASLYSFLTPLPLTPPSVRSSFVAHLLFSPPFSLEGCSQWRFLDLLALRPRSPCLFPSTTAKTSSTQFHTHHHDIRLPFNFCHLGPPSQVDDHIKRKEEKKKKKTYSVPHYYYLLSFQPISTKATYQSSRPTNRPINQSINQSLNQTIQKKSPNQTTINPPTFQHPTNLTYLHHARKSWKNAEQRGKKGAWKGEWDFWPSVRSIDGYNRCGCVAPPIPRNPTGGNRWGLYTVCVENQSVSSME
jgi:hypothetical protein